MAQLRYQHPFRGKWAFGTNFGVRGSMWAAGYHTGQDYWSRSQGGDGKVHPISTGTVSQIGTTGSYGNHVYVKHPDGYLSLYAHLSQIYVKVNANVGYDTVLGIEGSTGNSTGIHTHVEIHWQQYSYPATINPRTFINERLEVEDEVTQSEFDAMLANWLARNNKTYNNISEVPIYWRADVQELLDMGAIRGDGVHQIGLTEEALKAVIVAKRAIELENPTYATFSDVPDYFQAETRELIDANALRGDERGQLDINYDTLRAAIISKRYADDVVSREQETPSDTPVTPAETAPQETNPAAVEDPGEE